MYVTQRFELFQRKAIYKYLTITQFVEYPRNVLLFLQCPTANQNVFIYIHVLFLLRIPLLQMGKTIWIKFPPRGNASCLIIMQVRICDKQDFIHSPSTTSGNEEIFLQDFLVILKRRLQNYLCESVQASLLSGVFPERLTFR